MLHDVRKRPFITAGFTGFVLMIPLAATSTAGWIRRLGGRRWQMLHRLIYASAVAGVVHYYWLVKSDVRKPVFYGTIVALLLAYRLGNRLLRLALGADQQDTTTGGHDVADRLQPLVQHRLGLFEVDDMNPIADAEQVGRHFGVPSTGVMPKMNAGFEKLAH